MLKLRKVCYLLVLTVLPAGCGDPSAPTAPPAPAVKDSGPPPEPPKAVKKGRRTVHPGGATTNEP